MNIDITTMIFNLIGGLGIFLFGMKMMSEGLQKVAGDRLRTIFKMVTTNRFAGVFTGFLVTAIIQSSSATTVMLVGFVNAGLMTLQQAIHVIIGANIGTTFTGWIIAFKITKYGLPIIGGGAGLLLFSKRKQVNYFGEVALGLGMLFFGLTLMKQGFAPLRHEPSFQEFFLLFGADNLGQMLMSAFAGCMLTLILQSSSATIGITMGLASQGLLTFPAAAALVLGENIGTTITSLIASIGTSVNARRTALSHCLFNCIGVLLMFAIFPWYLKFVESVVPGIADLVLANGTKPNINAHIAASHTIFNIVNMLLFLPFVVTLAKLVSKIVKDRPIEKDLKTRRLRYLPSEDAFGIPSLMIGAARREIERMLDIAMLMLIRSQKSLLNEADEVEELLQKVKESEQEVDAMQEEIVEFLSQVSRHGALTEQDIEEVHIFFRVVDETESVADYAQRMIKLSHLMHTKSLKLSEDATKNLEALFEEMIDFLTMAKSCFLLRDPVIAKKCEVKKVIIKKMIKDANKAHVTRLRDGVCRVMPSISFNNFLNNYRGLRSHVTNIVEASMGEK